MARIRSIHPGLSSDEAYMSMSMPAKAGWTALWMHCDDHGIFEWKPIVLKALIFPADNIDFALLLDEWLALDCIKKVDIEGKPCGIVRNFAKYQRPKNPSYRYFKDCPSSDNLRPIRHFGKGGSGSSGLEFKRPAVDAASGGLR